MTKIINGPINKKNDAMFKAIITSPNNREMILDFIEAITNISKTILSKGVFSGGEEIPKRIITEKKQSVDINNSRNNPSEYKEISKSSNNKYR